VTRTQYQQLVQRLETAKLSEDADKTGVVSFQVIDPPTSLLEPVAPNRTLLLMGVFALAVGAAIGAAYLLNLLRPVFYDQRTLSEIMGLPVLGSVSRVTFAGVKVQQRVQLIAFSCGGVLLVMAFGLVLVLKESVARTVAQIVS
jgi:hypothetical protein